MFENPIYTYINRNRYSKGDKPVIDVQIAESIKDDLERLLKENGDQSKEIGKGYHHAGNTHSKIFNQYLESARRLDLDPAAIKEMFDEKIRNLYASNSPNGQIHSGVNNNQALKQSFSKDRIKYTEEFEERLGCCDTYLTEILENKNNQVEIDIIDKLVLEIKSKQYQEFTLFCFRNGRSQYQPLSQDDLWGQLLQERYDGIQGISEIREQISKETGFTLNREKHLENTRMNNPLYSWYYKNKNNLHNYQKNTASVDDKKEIKEQPAQTFSEKPIKNVKKKWTLSRIWRRILHG